MAPVKVTVETMGMRCTFDIPDAVAAEMAWPLDIIGIPGPADLGDTHHLRIAADVPRDSFSGWTPVERGGE